jgi:hypothetical protein
LAELRIEFRSHFVARTEVGALQGLRREFRKELRGCVKLNAGEFCHIEDGETT